MLQAIQSTISDIDSVGDPTAMSVDRAKALEWRIELVYRDLIAKEVAGELVSEEHEVLPIAGACAKHRVASISWCSTFSSNRWCRKAVVPHFLPSTKRIGIYAFECPTNCSSNWSVSEYCKETYERVQPFNKKYLLNYK